MQRLSAPVPIHAPALGGGTLHEPVEASSRRARLNSIIPISTWRCCGHVAPRLVDVEAVDAEDEAASIGARMKQSSLNRSATIEQSRDPLADDVAREKVTRGWGRFHGVKHLSEGEAGAGDCHGVVRS